MSNVIAQMKSYVRYALDSECLLEKKSSSVRTLSIVIQVPIYNNVMYAEYLDDEDHREERAIQYLVKDEVGALASTLEVISVSIA